ncbi:CLUMA_CG009481, isoform A [Clunio marinus]|uniref:CLUMA_CG009481, isoform A n=1 Tax=Clunio marinus TaxID=568069 RepID=A0A1J1I911_9DIPT|nr:CLUMA_CG009481, isoform A [Clunio marinus]
MQIFVDHNGKMNIELMMRNTSVLHLASVEVSRKIIFNSRTSIKKEKCTIQMHLKPWNASCKITSIANVSRESQLKAINLRPLEVCGREDEKKRVMRNNSKLLHVLVQKFHSESTLVYGTAEKSFENDERMNRLCISIVNRRDKGEKSP